MDESQINIKVNYVSLGSSVNIITEFRSSKRRTKHFSALTNKYL